jgi:hypothetical protein
MTRAARAAAEAATWITAAAVLALLLAPRALERERRGAAREAVVGTLHLARAAAAYAARHGVPPRATRAPAAACCGERGDRCDGRGFDGPVWQALGRPAEPPHRFQYEVEAEPARFVARARGDTDCDGVFATYEVVGERSGPSWRLSPVRVLGAWE